MSAHTPTPWFSLQEEAEDNIEITANSRAGMVPIAVIDSGGFVDEFDAEQAANAAHIVHCVNSHDVLVKALSDLSHAYVVLLEVGRDRITFLGGDCDSVEKMETGDPALIAARAAIAKAKGAA